MKQRVASRRSTEVRAHPGSRPTHQVGSRGVLIQAELEIGAAALADRHLFAAIGTRANAFQAASGLTLVRILQPVG
jgi:hypothetical protein